MSTALTLRAVSRMTRWVTRRDIARYELELDEKANEALLSTVVEITLDAPPFSIVVCDDSALGSVKVSQPRSGGCGQLGVAKAPVWWLA